MPASEGQEKQPRARLLPALFWSGVGLAPLAALLLLVGRGQSALRIAAVLAVLVVVLIGLSVALRKDGNALRAELEETFFDEMDLLRDDLRQDIGTAARATHHQFAQKLQALYESVESLRAQANGRYEPRQVHPSGVAAALPDPHAAPHPHAAPPHPHGAPPHPHAAVPGPPPPGQLGYGQVANGDHGQAGYGHVYVGSAGVPSPPAVGGGVVRHTETVQVTTRHTVVDPRREGQGGRGTVYGGPEYGRADESGNGWPGGDWREPAEESWTEQRLRERLGGQRGADHRDADPRDGRRHRAYERDDDDPGSDDRWSGAGEGDESWSARGARGGAGTVADRWASVRSDDRGRELRMGERRAAMHADESGTELRIEDRWASVRREEPPHWDSAERWSEDRWGPEVEDTGRWSERGGQAALPAGGTEPSWGQGWEAGQSRVEAGRAGRRRYRDDDSDGYGWQAELRDSPPPTRQRVLDHDLDDRWR